MTDQSSPETGLIGSGIAAVKFKEDTSHTKGAACTYICPNCQNHVHLSLDNDWFTVDVDEFDNQTSEPVSLSANHICPYCEHLVVLCRGFV